MSKEEFLKIQTCVLKVHIHCEGCKQKVKKILQKIEGVYKIHIDSEQGKVTVSGNVEPETLIKKLGKSGKHAELWGPPQKQSQNQQPSNQLKNLQIDSSGKGGNNSGQKGKIDNQQQPKTGGGPGGGGGGGGGGGKQGQNPNQLQQMKTPQDLKMAQFKDNPKMPFTKGAAKFSMPEDDDITDDEFDDFDDEDEDESEDDGIDDAPHLPLNKMKSMVGNGQMPNKMKAGQIQPQLVNFSQGKGNNGNKINNNNNAGNAKKGVGNGTAPVQMNGAKKVGGSNGNNPNQGGSGGGKGGKNGGSPPSGGKSGNGSNGVSAQSKNGKNAPAGIIGGDNFRTNNNGIGGVKTGGGGMNDGVQGLPKAISGGNAGHMGTMPMMGQMGGNPMGQTGGNPMGQTGGNPMGQMGGNPMGKMGGNPMGQMGGNPMRQMGGNPMGQMGAVQGLPAPAAIQAGAGGYFNGVRPEGMTGNQFYQQQMAAGMMNQPPVIANEGFHPMMYARPPPAVNYMPPHPYPYPYPYPYPPPADPYISSFSDENPSSCSMM